MGLVDAVAVELISPFESLVRRVTGRAPDTESNMDVQEKDKKKKMEALPAGYKYG